MEEWKECTIGDICESVSETYSRKDENVVLINTSDVLEGKFLTHATTKNENLKGQFKKLFRRMISFIQKFDLQTGVMLL